MNTIDPYLASIKRPLDPGDHTQEKENELPTDGENKPKFSIGHEDETKLSPLLTQRSFTIGGCP